MILTLNVDDAYISIGIFANDDKCNILHTFSLFSDINKTSDEYYSIIKNIFDNFNVSLNCFCGAIISSVVPQITDTIKETVYKLVEIVPIIVGPGVKTGFSIKIDDPSEMGADLVANAAAIAAENRKKTNQTAIIVDMGIVNTIFAINKFGEYIGGCIFPGVKLSLDTLRANTAQLPNVNMTLPDMAIGKNSKDSLRSGVILGNAIMIDGFIDRFAKEMKAKKDDIELFATGKNAPVVLKACVHNFKYRPNLTLEGLYHIYMRNVDNQNR